MEKINISIKNYRGFLLSLLPLSLLTFGLLFLSYIFLSSPEEIANIKYLFIAILLGNIYFFYLALKAVLFTLFGNQTILYDNENIIVKSSVFRISSAKKFKWKDIELIGGFSPKRKTGISESLGIKPVDKSVFFFGHLIKDSEKKAMAKELYNIFQKFKVNNGVQGTPQTTRSP